MKPDEISNLVYNNMTKKRLFIASTIILLSLLAQPVIVFAAKSSVSSTTGAEISKQLQAAGGKTGAGYGDPVDPRVTVSLIIRVLLETIGVLFVCLTVYAGFLWMTAGGKEEHIEKAKKLLFRAVVGLIIVLSAYSIAWFAAKIAFNYFDDPYKSGYEKLPNFKTPCEWLGCD